MNAKSLNEFHEKFIKFLDSQEIIPPKQKKLENQIDTIFSSILELQQRILLKIPENEVDNTIIEMSNKISG